MKNALLTVACVVSILGWGLVPAGAVHAQTLTMLGVTANERAQDGDPKTAAQNAGAIGAAGAAPRGLAVCGRVLCTTRFNYQVWLGLTGTPLRCAAPSASPTWSHRAASSVCRCR